MTPEATIESLRLRLASLEAFVAAIAVPAGRGTPEIISATKGPNVPYGDSWAMRAVVVQSGVANAAWGYYDTYASDGSTGLDWIGPDARQGVPWTGAGGGVVIADLGTTVLVQLGGTLINRGWAEALGVWDGPAIDLYVSCGLDATDAGRCGRLISSEFDAQFDIATPVNDGDGGAGNRQRWPSPVLRYAGGKSGHFTILCEPDLTVDRGSILSATDFSTESRNQVEQAPGDFAGMTPVWRDVTGNGLWKFRMELPVFDPQPLGGDLEGTTDQAVVVGLRTTPLLPIAPMPGDVLYAGPNGWGPHKLELDDSTYSFTFISSSVINEDGSLCGMTKPTPNDNIWTIYPRTGGWNAKWIQGTEISPDSVPFAGAMLSIDKESPGRGEWTVAGRGVAYSILGVVDNQVDTADSLAPRTNIVAPTSGTVLARQGGALGFFKDVILGDDTVDPLITGSLRVVLNSAGDSVQIAQSGIKVFRKDSSSSSPAFEIDTSGPTTVLRFSGRAAGDYGAYELKVDDDGVHVGRFWLGENICMPDRNGGIAVGIDHYAHLEDGSVLQFLNGILVDVTYT